MFLLGLGGGVYVFFSSVVWQRQLCMLKWKVTTMCQRHMQRLCLICKYSTLHSGLTLTRTYAETAFNGNKILSELVKVDKKSMNPLKCIWDFWKTTTLNFRCYTWPFTRTWITSSVQSYFMHISWAGLIAPQSYFSLAQQPFSFHLI